MIIQFMKNKALDYFKENLEDLYTYYFTHDDNSWMKERYGDDPFEDFIEIPDFELADIDSYDRLARGELDIDNCKIIYENLKMLTDSQAADERLWAGLTNGVFYDYMKRRWNNYELHSANKDIKSIRSRYFFTNKTRTGLYGNTLARAWWMGRDTYDANKENHFEKLDIIGATDFSTKAHCLFTSYTFAANRTILDGIISAIKILNDNDIHIIVKKDFRPALKYLNAYGGSVLLDSLTADEIKEIVLKKMLELKKGVDRTINYNVNDADEDIDIEEQVNDIDAEEHNTAVDILLSDINSHAASDLFVDYKDRVVVQKMFEDKNELTFDIPANRKDLDNYGANIIKELLGKAMGEKFFSGGKQFEILEIQKL